MIFKVRQDDFERQHYDVIVLTHVVVADVVVVVLFGFLADVEHHYDCPEMSILFKSDFRSFLFLK